MTTLTYTREDFDRWADAGEEKVCVFCDDVTTLPYCGGCQEYKGLMTIEEWEDYTGETWEA